SARKGSLSIDMLGTTSPASSSEKDSIRQGPTRRRSAPALASTRVRTAISAAGRPERRGARQAAMLLAVERRRPRRHGRPERGFMLQDLTQRRPPIADDEPQQ